jgi:phenylpropionate dioxygenase-like ring-hydroxylating dioxygenase large terminal subunit
MPSPWSLPDRLLAWYLVGASAEVRADRLLPWSLAGRTFVLGRRPDGRAFALDATCPHMGASLAEGTLCDGHVRCPLHHWSFDADGRCVRIPGANRAPETAPEAKSVAVVERLGAVWLFPAASPDLPPPALRRWDEAELDWTVGPVTRLDCPWWPLMANGFDMQHLQTVHGRALAEPPTLTTVDARRIALAYRSVVTGNRPADRVMRRLAPHGIDVRMTCHGGPVMVVETDLGRVRSALLLCVQPDGSGSRVRGVFGVARMGLPRPVRLAAARWLYTAFLTRDVAVMRGIRFEPRGGGPGDELLQQFSAFLERLPAEG